MPARNFSTLTGLLLVLLSLVSASPLPPHPRRDFVNLGNGAGAQAAAAPAPTATKAASCKAGGNKAAAGASGAQGGFIPLGNSGAGSSAGNGTQGAGSSSQNGGGNNNGGNGNGNNGGGSSQTQKITKIKETKTRIKLSNGDVKERDCVIKITQEVQQAVTNWVRHGDFTCADAAKNSSAIQSNSDGVAMCFRAGFIDQKNAQYGGELTVWNVGSSKDFSQAQVEMTFSDGSSLVTDAGALSGSSNATEIPHTVNGQPMTLAGSFHFIQALPSDVSAGDFSAFAPKSVNLATGGSDVKALGLLDITAQAGLPTESNFATTKWGLFDQTTTNVDVGKRAISNTGGFVPLGNGGGSSSNNGSSSQNGSGNQNGGNGNQKGGNGNNNGGNNGNGNTQKKVIVEDKQCKTTIIQNSGGAVISSGIVIQPFTTTISSGIVVTDPGTQTTTSSNSQSTGKGSGQQGNGNGGGNNNSGTTTTTSAASGSTSTGVGVNVQGFGTSVGGDAISSVLASVSGNGAAIVEASTTITSSGVTATAANGAVANAGVVGTQAADTAPSASSTPFQLPGRQLQVLPIGLGVFAGVSVITLIIVGVVTYERRKYRRQFRERRMAEQVSAAAGFGTFDSRMTEARV